MGLFNKKPKEELLELTDADDKTMLLKIQVYHPILWRTVLDFIAKNPGKLGAMAYNSNEKDKAIYMRLTPKSKRRKIVEFATEDGCKQFYDFLDRAIKDAKANRGTMSVD